MSWTFETVPPLNMASVRGKITIQTDLKDSPEVTVWAYGYVQPRIALLPQTIMVQQPLDREFRRRLVLKSAESVRFHAKEATASNAQLQVTLETVREGQEYSVWLTIPAGHVLPPAGETITIQTDDTRTPTLTASVRAFLSPQRNLATGPASTQRIQRPTGTMPGGWAASTRPALSPPPAPVTRPAGQRPVAPATQP